MHRLHLLEAVTFFVIYSNVAFHSFLSSRKHCSEPLLDAEYDIADIA